MFEWDENKRLKNIAKHGIDFADVVNMYKGFIIREPVTKNDYGEERFINIGLLNGLEIAVITTPRGDNTRIISARRARKTERKKYYEGREKHGDRLRETKSDEG